MSETHFPGGSTKTLPATVGRHDGHADGHLNCVALRHGWSRTFSISPQELALLDYDTLETILEVNTLKLRPMGLRIFIENPADSGNWSKVRFWKHDGSLQSVLVQQFFERRRADGVVTRLEVRDGADRQVEGDALSLRSVGSRILSRRDKAAEAKTSSSGVTSRWFTFGQSSQRKAKTRVASTDEEDQLVTEEPPATPPKISFFSLLRPHPKEPVSIRRTIFDFFRAKSTAKSAPVPRNSPSSEEQREMEEQNLRKRGWIPPGLVKRQRSLKTHLKESGLPADGTGGSKNPFFGSSKSVLTRADRKKKAAGGEEDGNPFGDDAAMQGPDELTEQDVDDFFEVGRSSSIMELSNQPANGKAWSRFKPAKERKNKGKGKNPSKGELGGGADIVQKPIDAFPDSPHHKKSDEIELD